jgi:hypothetical protein
VPYLPPGHLEVMLLAHLPEHIDAPGPQFGPARLPLTDQPAS